MGVFNWLGGKIAYPFEKASRALAKTKPVKAVNSAVTADGTGLFGVYKDFRYQIASHVNERIDQTNNASVATKRQFVFREKHLKIPDNLNIFKNQKPFKTGNRLQIAIDGGNYTLEKIRGIYGASSASGNTLYEIKGYTKGIKEHDKNKISKINAIWLDPSDNIASVNQPGRFINYDFEGKVRAFSFVDRNQKTGDINYLTSLVTWPIGAASAIVKGITYRASDLAFNTIPKFLDRAILPLGSGAVLLPAFLIAKPLSFLLPKSTAGKIDEFFSKAWRINKYILTDGASGYVKKELLDSETINEQIKHAKDGTLTTSNINALYFKKACTKSINLFSGALDGANVLVSNSANIISSAAKGFANLFAYVTNGFDNAYLDSAKFLFSEPFKILKREASNVVSGQEISANTNHAEEESRQEISFFDKQSSKPSNDSPFVSNTQLQSQAKKSGKDLRGSGVDNFDSSTAIMPFAGYACFNSKPPRLAALGG